MLIRLNLVGYAMLPQGAKMNVGKITQLSNPTLLLDRLFDTQMGDVFKLPNRLVETGYPFYDIQRTDEYNYIIKLAVAGFKKSDLNVTLENEVLCITGNVDSIVETNFLWKGISTKSFTRRFTLPKDATVNDVALVDGILTVQVSVPKPEAKPVNQIKIR
jgi:molecular chaperone IbpA